MYHIDEPGLIEIVFPNIQIHSIVRYKFYLYVYLNECSIYVY